MIVESETKENMKFSLGEISPQLQECTSDDAAVWL